MDSARTVANMLVKQAIPFVPLRGLALSDLGKIPFEVCRYTKTFSTDDEGYGHCDSHIIVMILFRFAIKYDCEEKYYYGEFNESCRNGSCELNDAVYAVEDQELSCQIEFMQSLIDDIKAVDFGVYDGDPVTFEAFAEEKIASFEKTFEESFDE